MRPSSTSSQPEDVSGSVRNTTDDLWRLDAVDQARLIRLGVVSSREVVESNLSRMDDVNPHLKAVVHHFPDEARAAADAADAALRRGEEIGPLHGVPVTVKINTDQRGQPTDGGVVAYKDVIATEDSPVVINFRRAGAIIVGRTNAPAYSMRWFTDNELHGETLNPFAPDRTAGGSSGGAASAVAAGIGAIAHGNDIAGSIRYPAYCCGVVGLRPSYGRVPSYNATGGGASTISSQLMAVQGPLARSVRDVRLGLAALAVDDLRDPRFTEPAGLPRSSRPLRVALAPDPAGNGDVHPAILQAVRQAGRALADAGYVVEETVLPNFVEAADLWPDLAMPDVIAQLEPLIEKNGDDAIRRAVALWRAVWPIRDPAATLAALGRRHGLLRVWQQFLAEWPVVITPVSNALPFPVGHDLKDEDTTRAILTAQVPLTAVSVLGLPAVSVPTGFHKGIPVGVQIIGGRFREDLCLDAAEVIEARLGPALPVDPRRAGA